MVRKKTLSPSGAQDKDGQYNNAHINLHRDELEAAGMEIGDEVFVRVREDMLIIQKPKEGTELQHEFRGD